ncbi:MAG: hypothetical protein HY819_10000 [Acidobacteria bacterium]|nr:hypothetical protein [Acidobacteriota bacterium]
MDFNNAHKERNLAPQNFFAAGVFAFLAHALLFGLMFLWIGKLPDVLIIAAGEGEGGEGGGGAIQVGVANASEILDVSLKKPIVSSLNTEKNPDKLNNEILKHEDEPVDKPEEVLEKKDKPDPEAKKTNLPVQEKPNRIWTKTTQKANSTETTASIGTSSGSLKPAIRGGIGISDNSNSGIGTGLPGGSEYGRRIQNILSRNFTPPTITVNGTVNVIVYIKITREGKVTSVVGGRVPKNFFKQLSPYEQLNYAAERAVIATATQGLPPFPGNFLIGTQEAVAEIWFQYP